MRVLAISLVPAYYQVPIFRGLAERLGKDFLACFACSGQAKGVYEPTWGQVVSHGEGLLQGYDHVVLGIEPEMMRRRLTRPHRMRANQLVDQFKPDVVLTNMLGSPFCRHLLRYCRCRGARIALRSTPIDVGRRAWWKKVLRPWWYRWQYRHVDVACAVGRTARAHFLRAGLPSGRIFDANYCTDEWVLSPLVAKRQELRHSTRSEWAIPPDATVISWAGRFIDIKRVDQIIEVAHRLAADENIYWVLAGNGPRYQNIEDMIRNRGLARVRLTGFLPRERVGALLAASDVYVLPSVYEPYGVVLQEAMMFGCACVTTDMVGAGYDLITGPSMGRQFRADDIDGFEESVLRVLEMVRDDPDCWRKVQTGVAHRTVANAVAGVVRAFEFVLGNPGRQ